MQKAKGKLKDADQWARVGLLGRWLLIGLLGGGLAPAVARGDRITLSDGQGGTQTIEARPVVSDAKVLVVELPDGQYRFLPTKAIARREAADGPEPWDGAAVLASLQKKFGATRFKGLVHEPYVVGLVLAGPLPVGGDSRAAGLLRQTGAFLKNVDAAFGKFVKEARIPAKPPEHPLVALIFEGQSDFEDYVRAEAAGASISAAHISGFYSRRTNFLALRLVECRTFDVVLHEAIHQQTFNRRMFRRLAPLPAWFEEGIATGFEANQGKISVGPGKISPRYARQALEAKSVTTERMAVDDDVFHQDETALDAYGLAWGLHWLAVTKYRPEYGKYLRCLAEKKPLDEESAASRVADFKAAFGKEPAELGREFRGALDAGLKAQKVTLEKPKPVGTLTTTQSHGEVKLSAVRRMDMGGRLEAAGTLVNISPLRPLAFHVTVETDAGAYAEWFVPSLDVNKSQNLASQRVAKPMARLTSDGQVAIPAAGSVLNAGQTFRVRIRSTPADSSDADQWRKGRLPIPVVGTRETVLPPEN